MSRWSSATGIQAFAVQHFPGKRETKVRNFLGYLSLARWFNCGYGVFKASPGDQALRTLTVRPMMFR